MTSTLPSRAFGTDITNQLTKCQPQTKQSQLNAKCSNNKTSTLKTLADGLADRDVSFMQSPKKPKPIKPAFKRQRGICLRIDCHAEPIAKPPTMAAAMSIDSIADNNSLRISTPYNKPPTVQRHLSVPIISGTPPIISGSPASPLDGVLGPKSYPETPYVDHSISLSFLNECDGRHYIRKRGDGNTSPVEEGQHLVSKKDREILVDWIIRICNKFDLSELTVYLSINIFDRYLASLRGKIQGDRQHTFQLIACATMWIASKYHEVYAPEPDDFAVLTSGAVSKDELIEMELSVLVAIGMELTIETPLSFIPRFNDIGCAYIDMKKGKDGKPKDAESKDTQKKILHSMMMFCLEISSLDYKLSLEKPSKVAVAIMYYCCIGTNIFSWNQFKDDNVLKFVNHYRVNDVLGIMQKIHRISIKIEKEKQSRIYEKYSAKKHYRVTKIAKKMSQQKGLSM